MTTKELQKQAILERDERILFRRVFSTEDGKNVLTWLLNQCGYFSQDPKDVDPLMIAMCNRLLGKIGIDQPSNLFEDVAVRVDNANDRDLDQIINTKLEGGDL